MQGRGRIPALPISPDALTGRVGWNGRRYQRSAVDKLFVEKSKEERFVLYDRAAVAKGELVQVVPIRFGCRPGVAFICPRVCIEGCVLDIPDGGPRILIRPRARLNLDLRVAAAQFSIDRRQDQPDFPDKIGVNDVSRHDLTAPKRSGVS